MVTADGQGMRPVGRGERELRWRAGDGSLDQAAVDAHDLGRLVDRSAGLAEQRARRGAHHLDAILLKQPKRGEMDRFDLVIAERRQWRDMVTNIPPAGLVGKLV